MEIPVFKANSVDLGQTPRSAVFDLGLHCLLMSLLWDARHKWVKHTNPDKPLTDEILKQGLRYHKLRETCSKSYRRYSEYIKKKRKKRKEKMNF